MWADINKRSWNESIEFNQFNQTVCIYLEKVAKDTYYVLEENFYNKNTFKK